MKKNSFAVSFWVREYFFIPYLATDNYSTRAMKILLLGEYSNVHWTLAEGLRQLGHEVTVASNGDFGRIIRAMWISTAVQALLVVWTICFVCCGMCPV